MAKSQVGMCVSVWAHIGLLLTKRKKVITRSYITSISQHPFAFKNFPNLSVWNSVYILAVSGFRYFTFPQFSITIANPRCGTWAFFAPSALFCSASSALLPGWRWMVDEHVSLFMLYCALGIHIDESGSPEERQSGDGTSFPESPDLNHVGIPAAFPRLAPQRLAFTER